MSKSNPATGTHRATAHHAPAHPRKKPFFPKLVSFSRTIHIYLTMMGIFAMLLFGVTGYTVNHEDFFGATHPYVVELKGEIPPALLKSDNRLAIVERLRSAYRISGAVTSYDDFDDEVSIAFKEPGQIWEIRVNKASGGVDLHHEAFNFFAVINNLHRGRYSGEAWRWVIDISAWLIVLACVTGFILWLALPRRRRLGVAVLAVGTILTLAVIYFLVPGADWGMKPPATPPTSATAGK